VGHIEHKFQGEGGCPPTTFGVRKLKSWVIMQRCLRDLMFSCLDTIPACDTHMHTDTQTVI